MRLVWPARARDVDGVLCVSSLSLSSSFSPCSLPPLPHDTPHTAGHCQGSFDLCTPCLLAGASARQAHNPAHIFVAFKRAVDFDLHDRLTRSMTRRPRGLLEVDLYA